MKQETIGSKGTVPGFRPLIGEERWCNGDFNLGSLIGGFRPYLASESKNGNWGVTRRLLPPPAVETFEAHGHIWYKHTPGDECPVEPNAVVSVFFREGKPSTSKASSAKTWYWSNEADEVDIIGYRFPDYPAVHTTLRQEQPCVDTQVNASAQPPTETIPTQFSTEQRLTSLYNDWCFLPPETVAECIADVASVLYPTDAERCEAAFQRWKDYEYKESCVYEWTSKEAWRAAWKAAKESKV